MGAQLRHRLVAVRADAVERERQAEEGQRVVGTAPHDAGKSPSPGADPDKPQGDEGISPAEDLMREHGLLNRLLLIYDQHVHMLAEKQPFDGPLFVRFGDQVHVLGGQLARAMRVEMRA